MHPYFFALPLREILNNSPVWPRVDTCPLEKLKWRNKGDHGLTNLPRQPVSGVDFRFQPGTKRYSWYANRRSSTGVFLRPRSATLLVLVTGRLSVRQSVHVDVQCRSGTDVPRALDDSDDG